MEKVSIIIPAFNEEARIEQTLRALRASGTWFSEIIVVDDGSIDNTSTKAQEWADQVLTLSINVGKAKALEHGSKQASYPILLFLDADLAHSAKNAEVLVEPVRRREADMSVAVLPSTKKGGFGLIKKFAAWSIYKFTGMKLLAPLSGQRAIRKEIFERIYRGDRGFGIEVGLTLDVLLAGYLIQEVEVEFYHREHGKKLTGFIHRFKQGLSVCQALLSRR